MKAAFAATAVFVFAAPAYAQTAAAPAAPVAPYVSTCVQPPDSAMPKIPDGKTAKNADINRANKAMDAWAKLVTAYGQCKKAELDKIQLEVNAAQANSPDALLVKSFNAQVTNLNAGVQALQASGIKMPPLEGQPKKAPKCGTEPDLTPAPAIPTAAEVAGMKSGDVRKVSTAFVKWASPRNIYVQCMQPTVEAAVKNNSTAAAAPLAKGVAAKAEYDAFMLKADKVNADWKVYSDAYAARLKAAQGR